MATYMRPLERGSKVDNSKNPLHRLARDQNASLKDKPPATRTPHFRSEAFHIPGDWEGGGYGVGRNSPQFFVHYIHECIVL